LFLLPALQIPDLGYGPALEQERWVRLARNRPVFFTITYFGSCPSPATLAKAKAMQVAIAGMLQPAAARDRLGSIWFCGWVQVGPVLQYSPWSTPRHQP
jgi:hypothetical protein